MKRISTYIIVLVIISLITGCDILHSDDQTSTHNLSLKGFDISGLYANRDRIVAGASSPDEASKYIFISADNGSTWKQTAKIPFNNNGSPPYDLILINPHIAFWGKSNVIFAGIGGGIQGQFLTSPDNGKTWIEPNPKFTDNVNCFTMINGTLFAGTNYGVFTTKDNGNHWVGADTASLSYPVAGLVSVAGNLFAATSGHGIYRFINKETSWTRVDTTGFSFTSLVAIGDDLFAGVVQSYGQDSAGGVYMSPDRGASWSHVDAPGIARHTINVLYTNGSDLFAATNSGTYYSTNKGADWVSLDSLSATSFAANDTWLFVGTRNSVKRYALSKLNK